MWRVFLLLSALKCADSSVNPCTDRNHLFLVPGVLTAGGSNRACVSRFYTIGSAHMTLSLRTEDNQFTTASRILSTGDGGCLDIAVPQKPNTKADLTVNLKYSEAECTWERRLAVRIAGGRLVVVHTDRARYRPGDTLRIRVFALRTNLAPAQGAIDEVWVEGPRGAWDGTRVTQWLHVPTRMGISQMQYEIDELAPTGRWTVRARFSDGSQGSAGFLVGNYELPPFQMSVRHPARVLNTSERLVWNVCVRYPWTEAVEGMLVIRIRGAGGMGGGGEGIRTAVRLRAPVACHRHAAAAKRIGLNDINPPDVVVADFSFQEDGTGTWQNTTVVSRVVDKAVTLEFLTKHRAVISPGLPCKLKVKATRWDEKPASGERIIVCRSPATAAMGLAAGAAANLTQTCNQVLTDEKGVARVMFMSAEDSSAYYKFQAMLQNDSTVAAAPLLLPARRGSVIHAALGPLRPDKQADRTLVPLYLTMKNTTKPVTVHFVVITRGGIIYRWGATTQCAIASTGDYYQIASRDGRCDAVRPYTNLAQNTNASDISDSLLDRLMLRVMLPIKVTHQMCPDSHLIAYFYHEEELVSASKYFEMDECFANKVETTWLSRQVAPGSLVRLHIRTDSRALCALGALDTAARYPPLAPSTSAAALLAALRRLLESQRNLTEYDAAGHCFLMSDILELPSTSLELTATWLAAAGVRILGGNTPPARRCSPAPLPLIDDDVAVPRSDFSEAWLWRLVDVGVNGSTITNARAPDSISRFEANAICVSKSGLAVSTPATLQVFREFFIHADSPRRLRRGDTTIIRYRLFNYLYEPLSVQIQILTDPHLEGPVNYVETACIAARSSTARHVEVRARLPGNARLSVRAKSVKDGNCGNYTIGKTGVSDEVIIQIMVDPEGIAIQEHQSALLCAEGSEESSTSQLTWSWSPVEAVPGTEGLAVWAVGDVAGPLFVDADALVLLPRGCGEQNMARLATNLLALSQLSPVSTAASIAREHVARGFTRQLQYVHPSGGFSAFGSSDVMPSTWLTAFALKYLRKAHQILSPGLPAPPALDRAEQWLLKQQMENGCFRNEGQVFHRELKGGLNEEGEIASVALTAYIITALIESSTTLSYRVVRNTLSCLRALPPMKTRSPTRVYAQALLAYTFMRLRRYEEELMKMNEAIQMETKKVAGLQADEELKELVELLNIAKRSGDNVWWETSSLSTSIEATGYALLALSHCPRHLRQSNCAHDARGAVRWLSTHRNSAGGFISTQDTLVALEALISWSAVQPSIPTNLTVTALSGRTTRTIKLKPGIRVPEVLKLENSDLLNIAVKGSGCALVQATRSYHSLSDEGSRDKQLSVQVTVHTDGPFGCTNNACFCAAVVEACVVWSGSFPEMALLEVTLPGGFGADASLLYSQLHQTNTLLRRIELTPNNGRATLYLACRDGSDSLGRGGHQCYTIHAVGPKTRTRPAHARIINYYAPSINDTQMYTIPEDCLPRISNESSGYHPEDNLYNKAKSLSDSGEIVIMHEYSFEDIPDGIPLEDPIYDNLTQDQKPMQISNNMLSNNTHINDNLNEKHGILEAKISRVNTNYYEPNNVALNKNLEQQYAGNTSHQTFVPTPMTNIDSETLTKKNPIKEMNSYNKESENDVKLVYTHKIEERDDREENTSPLPERTVENPNLSDFHIIESEKDLDVPTGIEGPIPAIVLPPQNFVAVALPPSIQPGDPPHSPPSETYREFQYYPPPEYSYYFHHNPYRNFRRYHSYITPFGYVF